MSMIRRVLEVSALVASLLGTPRVAAAASTKQECVDTNERGQTLLQQDHLHAARASFAQCVSTACPGPVRQDCAARIVEIDRVMPAIEFDVRDAAGHELTGVSLRVHGDLVAVRLDGGVAVPIDPGTHDVELVPQTGAARRETIVVRRGEKDRIEHVVLDPGAPAGADPRSVWRTTAMALTGAGAVGLVAGGILGVLAKTTYDAALTDSCGGSARTCDAAGASKVSAAHEQAAAATGGVIAGAALVVGGVALWATATREIRLAPTTGGAVLEIGGRF